MRIRWAIHANVIVVSRPRRSSLHAFRLPAPRRFLPYFFLLPAPPCQFLPHQPLGLFLLALLQLRSVVVRASPLAHLRQQLLPKSRLPQTPTTPHRLPRFGIVLLPAPFLHPLFKHPPPCRA